MRGTLSHFATVQPVTSAVFRFVVSARRALSKKRFASSQLYRIHLRRLLKRRDESALRELMHLFCALLAFRLKEPFEFRLRVLCSVRGMKDSLSRKEESVFMRRVVQSRVVGLGLFHILESHLEDANEC